MAPDTAADRVTDQVVAGLLVRRQLRAGLDAMGVPYREHKGMLDSIFVVTATRAEWRVIVGWARRVSSVPVDGP